jgi:hypothetical protein
MPWAMAVAHHTGAHTVGLNPETFHPLFESALLSDPQHQAVWPVVRRLWAEADAWVRRLDFLDACATTHRQPTRDTPLLVQSPDVPTREGILLAISHAPPIVRDPLLRGLSTAPPEAAPVVPGGDPQRPAPPARRREHRARVRRAGAR